MAGVHRQIVRGQRLVAEEVDDVEALAEHHQLLVILEIAAAAATLYVMRVRRAGDEAEMDLVTADDQGAVRVHRCQGEVWLGAGNGRFDQAAVGLHNHRGVVHLGPGGAENLAGRRANHLDAVFLEQAQRGQMDGFDLVVTERRQRRHVVADLAPVQLRRKRIVGTRFAAASCRSCRRIHGALVLSPPSGRNPTFHACAAIAAACGKTVSFCSDSDGFPGCVPASARAGLKKLQSPYFWENVMPRRRPDLPPAE